MIDALPIMDDALLSVGVPPADRYKFYPVIYSAIIAQIFHNTPKNNKANPIDINNAMNEVEAGLDEITSGLNKISSGMNYIDISILTARHADQARLKNLKIFQATCIRAISESVIRRVFPYAIDESVCEAIDHALPDYGYLDTSNKWNHAFSEASHTISKIKGSFDAKSFNTPPRSKDERLIHLIGRLAEVYQAASGKPPLAYERNDTVRSDWRPPFCQFVAKLWPALGPFAGAEPTDGIIERALAAYRSLPETSKN